MRLSMAMMWQHAYESFSADGSRSCTKPCRPQCCRELFPCLTQMGQDFVPNNLLPEIDFATVHICALCLKPSLQM